MPCSIIKFVKDELKYSALADLKIFTKMLSWVLISEQKLWGIKKILEQDFIS